MTDALSWFSVTDALRVINECPCTLTAAFFGVANQRAVYAQLASRVADATGVRIVPQDPVQMLQVMARAYRGAKVTDVDSTADVPAINKLLLSYLVPYVISGVEMTMYHNARLSAAANTKTTAAPTAAAAAAGGV